MREDGFVLSRQIEVNTPPFQETKEPAVLKMTSETEIYAGNTC